MKLVFRPSLRQRGAALLLLVLGILAALAALWLTLFSSAASTARQRAQTIAALAQAKEAVLAYAFDRHNLNSSDSLVEMFNREDNFGALPCPDTNNHPANDTAFGGIGDGDCGDGIGSTYPEQRLGRLPRDVARQNLVDGTGERLWYAVASNYKKQTTILVNTGSDDQKYARLLNADLPATLQLRSSAGTITSEIVALLIAPGAAMLRQDGVLQDRHNNQQLCSAPNTDPQCAARNYLEVATLNGVTFDNALMTGNHYQTSAPKIFQNFVKDQAGNLLVNDSILPITRDDWRRAAETRLARLLARCLTARWALSTLSHAEKMPRAVATANSLALSATWHSDAGQRIGRLPENDANGNSHWHLLSPQLCNAAQFTLADLRDGYWNSWRQQIFLISAQASHANTPLNANSCDLPRHCLTLVESDGKLRADKILAALIFAGPTLPGKTRATASARAQISNFLESVSATGAAPQALDLAQPTEKIRYVARAQRSTTPFNDRICYIQLQHLIDPRNLSACASTTNNASDAQACGSFIQCLD